MNRNDLKAYFARFKKAEQDAFVGVNSNPRKRTLNESVMKNIYGDCQNILFEMAQENGYVCHLCASQAAKQCGIDQFQEIDMGLCCQIIEDCILSGLLQAGSCPEHPQVTVYFPVLETGDGLDYYTQNIPDVDLDYGSLEAEEDALEALRNPNYDEDTEDDFSHEYKEMIRKGRRGSYNK